ncbi:MAG TPA: hypothetical protein VFD73_25780 [Gemmatimonadales bacterium]|nr:hypothetical protein [Gemmatimonadales bacterium]
MTDFRRILHRDTNTRISMRRVLAAALGFGSLGALAGAFAVGAVGIKRLGIARLALGSGRIGRLAVDELDVNRLRLRELSTDSPFDDTATALR